MQLRDIRVEALLVEPVEHLLKLIHWRDRHLLEFDGPPQDLAEDLGGLPVGKLAAGVFQFEAHKVGNSDFIVGDRSGMNRLSFLW